MQDITIIDDSTCCTLVLYGDYVDSLEKGTTYTLENVRIRKVNGFVYLNTSPLQPFSFHKSVDFVALARVNTPDSRSTSTFRVLGVSKINMSYFCKMCSRKGNLTQDNKFQCEKCSIKVNKSSASLKLTMTLPMENVTTKEQLLLYFNYDSTMAMINLFKIKDFQDDNELANFFFGENLPLVRLTIDSMSKSVVKVEPCTHD